MTCGWSTRPRSSVGARERRRNGRIFAGWAQYGYCASHSRFFWRLRLHLVCTLSGLPVAFALAGAKADEREVLLGMLDADPNLVAAHPNQKLMAGSKKLRQGIRSRLADAEVELLRPARKGENPTARATGTAKPFGRVIEKSRSMTRSRPNSTSNATAEGPSRASHREYCNASSPSPPRSGTSTHSPAHAAFASPAYDH